MFESLRTLLSRNPLVFAVAGLMLGVVAGWIVSSVSHTNRIDALKDREASSNRKIASLEKLTGSLKKELLATRSKVDALASESAKFEKELKLAIGKAAEAHAAIRERSTLRKELTEHVQKLKAELAAVHKRMSETKGIASIGPNERTETKSSKYAELEEIEENLKNKVAGATELLLDMYK